MMRTPLAVLLALCVTLPALGGAARGEQVAGHARPTGTHPSRLHGASESSGRGPRGKTRRSGAARAGFRRGHPCPSTGRTTGACPGYQVDHVRPLACGGADAPSNMQWLTTAENQRKGSQGCRRR